MQSRPLQTGFIHRSHPLIGAIQFILGPNLFGPHLGGLVLDLLKSLVLVLNTRLMDLEPALLI